MRQRNSYEKNQQFIYFNPRTHVGCDTACRFRSFLHPNFNPRTHVGCDLIREAIKIRSGDFNPRTHVGCDLSIFTTVPYISNFNPRTHVGCDNLAGDIFRISGISIHAPTWGATISSGVYPLTTLNFNPRTHVGCDHGSIRQRARDYNFNPRTHVGCDLLRRDELSRIAFISIHAPTWGATLFVIY